MAARGKGMEGTVEVLRKRLEKRDRDLKEREKECGG
jgi:hypothetical protein